MLAQGLIARVYNAIRHNEELWNSTLLIVTYDEHGGFYDHVEPPTSVCPDEHKGDYSFDRLGVRVPAVLVSPWLDAGVFSEQLDHTSVGKYLSEKWGINPLGERMRLANSLGGAFGDRNTPRTDTPERISVPSSKISAVVTESVELNENQMALLALSRRLEDEWRMRQKGDGKIFTMQEPPDPNDITALRDRIIRFIED